MRTAMLLCLSISLILTGCRDPNRVDLYEFAGTTFYDTVDFTIDPLEERFNRALRLYKQGRYPDADRCAYSLVDTELSTYAWELCGLIATRQGWYLTAERCLRKAIATKPNREDTRIALIWSLCQAGEFDKAEDEACVLTDKSSSSLAWAALQAVRDQRDYWPRFWRVTFNVICVLGMIIYLLVLTVLAIRSHRRKPATSPCSG